MKVLMLASAICVVSAAGANAQTVGCVKPGVYVVGKGVTNMRAAFTRMQIDSIFNGVALGAEGQKNAEGIIDEAKARSPGIASRDDAAHDAIMKGRNERLLVLVSSPADKEKVRQNLEAMAQSPHRCDVSA